MNDDTCDWPDCDNEAMCSSGNAGGALVCREHFAITNGKDESELSDEERKAIGFVATREDEMLVMFEISRPFQLRPGRRRSTLGNRTFRRWWWLWFAVTIYPARLDEYGEAVRGGEWVDSHPRTAVG